MQLLWETFILNVCKSVFLRSRLKIYTKYELIFSYFKLLKIMNGIWIIFKGSLLQFYFILFLNKTYKWKIKKRKEEKDGIDISLKKRNREDK